MKPYHESWIPYVGDNDFDDIIYWFRYWTFLFLVHYPWEPHIFILVLVVHVKDVFASTHCSRQRIIERERTWETRRVEKESGSEQMRDQHRQKVLNQVRQDWQRVKDDQDRLAATRDAKRALSSEMRTQHNERAVREAGREDRRIEALRARREQLQTNKQETENRQADTEIRRQVCSKSVHLWVMWLLTLKIDTATSSFFLKAIRVEYLHFNSNQWKRTCCTLIWDC